jgi:hypothetical protein
MSLLCEVMARLRGADMPVIQFIQVSGESDTAETAMRFASNSATYFGRTLLVRLSAARVRDVHQVAATNVTIAGLLTRKSSADPIEIVPDSAVSGLSHACIGIHPGDAAQRALFPAESRLDDMALDFRLIVIASDPPETTPATLELATRCHGSVLVVSAGHTSLSQVRDATRRVRLAGGTLMGCVLEGAPPSPKYHIFPRWLRPASHSTR